jgi:hypothetical protein
MMMNVGETSYQNSDNTRFIPWRFIWILVVSVGLYFLCTYLASPDSSFSRMYQDLFSWFSMSAGLTFVSFLGCGALCFLWMRTQRNTFFRICECLAMSFFVAIISYFYQHPLRNGLPSAGDHITHFTLASLTEWNLLFFHRLSGWCSAINTGIPLNELYPPGGNLLVCILRGLTFGLISREWIYTYTVLLTYFAFAFLLYAIVRRYFGRLSACLFLGLLCLDSGETFFGFFQSLGGGMWASQLGVALTYWAFSVSAHEDNLSQRQGILLVLAVGAAILLHPFSFFLVVTWAVLLFIHWGVFDRPAAIKFPLPVFICIGLGIGLSGFYLVPFMYSRPWIAPYGSWGSVFPDLGREVLAGTMFRQSPILFTILGIPSILVGLCARRRFIRLLAFYSVCFLFLSTHSALVFFSLESVMRFFDHMQVSRLLGVARIGTMILVAGFTGLAVARLSDTFTDQLKQTSAWFFSPLGVDRKRAIVHVLMLLLLVCLIIVMVVPITYFVDDCTALFGFQELAPYLERIAAVPVEPVFWEDMVKIAEPFSSSRADKFAMLSNPLPEERLLGFEPWRPIVLSVYSGMPLYGDGYMPAILLGTRLSGSDEWSLQIANVRYVLALSEDSSPKSEPIRHTPSVSLYERNGWSGEGWIIHGQAQVIRVPVQDGRLQFEISHAHEGASLRIGISRYRKWKAFLNGAPVSTVLSAQPGEPGKAENLIGVPIQDGTLELVYQDEWIDKSARVLSLLSFGLLLTFLLSPVWNWIGKFSLALISWWWIDVCIVIAAIVFLFSTLLYHQPPKSPLFFLYGLHGDQVGHYSRHPDHINDWTFLLSFNRDESHGKIERLVIEEILPDGQVHGNHRWVTDESPYWKIAVLDGYGARCDRADGALRLPGSKRQELVLFLGACYNNALPAGHHFRCSVIYKDGTVVRY